ncbi:hypothetical protein ACJ41O_006254 [Fusarium nematophilum]
MANQWDPKDLSIIEIGGRNLGYNFDYEVPKAFASEGEFPNDFAFAKAMEPWHNVTDGLYQTSEEMGIIEATAKIVVTEMPSAIIIDMGPAKSKKYVPYVRELLAQKKQCTYIALDLCRDSLDAQIKDAKARFPSIRCVGLWGNFLQGSAYCRHIPGPRLFLSLGSSLFNCEEETYRKRCEEVRGLLSGFDRLVVGQDAPWSSEAEKNKVHASYNTANFKAFISRYLDRLQAHVGIRADATTAWSVESKLTDKKHVFEVMATQDMVCDNIPNKFMVKKGTLYTIFPSWKRSESEMHAIAAEAGLSIRTIGMALGLGSTMRQYLVQPK